jgi:hypothetical protein
MLGNAMIFRRTDPNIANHGVVHESTMSFFLPVDQRFRSRDSRQFVQGFAAQPVGDLG